MSAWRLALKELHEMGGTAGGSLFGDNSARDKLRELGLIARYDPPPRRLGDLGRPAPKSEHDRLWRITPRGTEVVENRVVQVETRPGGRRWVATWLMSLPKINFNESRA